MVTLVLQKVFDSYRLFPPFCTQALSGTGDFLMYSQPVLLVRWREGRWTQTPAPPNGVATPLLASESHAASNFRLRAGQEVHNPSDSASFSREWGPASSCSSRLSSVPAVALFRRSTTDPCQQCRPSRTRAPSGASNCDPSRKSILHPSHASCSPYDG